MIILNAVCRLFCAAFLVCAFSGFAESQTLKLETVSNRTELKFGGDSGQIVSQSSASYVLRTDENADSMFLTNIPTVGVFHYSRRCSSPVLTTRNFRAAEIFQFPTR